MRCDTAHDNVCPIFWYLQHYDGNFKDEVENCCEPEAGAQVFAVLQSLTVSLKVVSHAPADGIHTAGPRIPYCVCAGNYEAEVVH